MEKIPIPRNDAKAGPRRPDVAVAASRDPRQHPVPPGRAAGEGRPLLNLRRRQLSPLLMSVILHAILLVLVGLFWTRRSSGSGGEPDRPVGIAMVHRLPDRDRYVEAQVPSSKEQSEESTAEPASDAAAAAASPPADLASPLDLAGLLSEMQATPAPEGASGLAGDSLIGAEDFGSGTGQRVTAADDGETTTVLFGVSGSGSRFVYVFDRSDSMNGYGGRPLLAAKTELLSSLRSMSDKQQFQIIFYNDTPKPFRVGSLPLQLVPGEPGMIERAEHYVASVAAFGGTEHDSALKMALRMAPDVIFFLTDARVPRLSQTELMEIRGRAERAGTTIHAIEFGPEPTPPAESFLRDLAAQNLGQYQYVDVQKLGTN